MCTLIVIHRVVPGLPAVFAANRDEFFARPSAGPQVLDRQTGIVGGRDLVAGGTWMGLTPGGFFAGLTNQRQVGGADRARRSRGEVVLETLRAGAVGGVPAARAYLDGLDGRDYNPFNLIFGTAEALWAAYGRSAGDGRLRFEVVPPGVHVLPNDVLDSTAFPKVRRIRARLTDLPESWPALEARLIAVLADETPPEALPETGDGGLPLPVRRALHAVKVVLPEYGTRTSSLAALVPGGVARYAFADGPPGETAFVDHLPLLAAAEEAR